MVVNFAAIHIVRIDVPVFFMHWISNKGITDDENEGNRNNFDDISNLEVRYALFYFLIDQRPISAPFCVQIII